MTAAAASDHVVLGARPGAAARGRRARRRSPRCGRPAAAASRRRRRAAGCPRNATGTTGAPVTRARYAAPARGERHVAGTAGALGEDPDDVPVLQRRAARSGSRRGRRASGRAGSGPRPAGTCPAARRTSRAWSGRAPGAGRRSRAAARRASRRGWRPSRPVRSAGTCSAPWSSTSHQRPHQRVRDEASGGAACRCAGRARRRSRAALHRRCGERSLMAGSPARPGSRLHERDHLVDDLVEGVRRGVEVDGTVGHDRRGGGATGVDRVAAQQVGLGGRDATRPVLRRTTGGAGRRVGGQVDLHRGVGPTTEPMSRPSTTMPPSPMIERCRLEQPLAHLGHGGDRADVVGDRLGADLDRRRRRRRR